MTPADKAALVALWRMNLGTWLELACVSALLTAGDDLTELERIAVHRILQKYGPQLGL